jgi:hypothetical protein
VLTTCFAASGPYRLIGRLTKHVRSGVYLILNKRGMVRELEKCGGQVQVRMTENKWVPMGHVKDRARSRGRDDI